MTKKQTATERLAEAKAELSKLEGDLEAMYHARIIDGAKIAAVSAHLAVLRERIADLTPRADAEAKAEAALKRQAAHKRMLAKVDEFQAAWANAGVVEALENVIPTLERLCSEVRSEAYQARALQNARAQGCLSDVNWLRKELKRLQYVKLG